MRKLYDRWRQNQLWGQVQCRGLGQCKGELQPVSFHPCPFVTRKILTVLSIHLSVHARSSASPVHRVSSFNRVCTSIPCLFSIDITHRLICLSGVCSTQGRFKRPPPDTSARLFMPGAPAEVSATAVVSCPARSHGPCRST